MIDNSIVSAPLVSIFCPTYNHEKYIRQCLDGIIMQKSNFEFEVVIHDDASDDSTQKIIQEYEEKYPHIIRTILQKENQFSKDNLHLIKTMLSNAKGKYIAICEGDDYWIDESKLQSQVDFLESNLDYSICFHEVKVLKNNELVDDFVVWGEVKDDSSIEDLVEFNYIHTPTVMYRNEFSVLNNIANISGDVLGDYTLNLIFASFGKIKRLRGKWAVYRYGIGMWSGEQDQKKKKDISLNTLRNTALILNENHMLLNKWYQYLIFNNELFCLNYSHLNSFEKILANIYSNSNVARNIKMKDLMIVFFKKLYRNI
jgi:glycosyltransferase involved in cell wall biosynthesis